MTSSFVGTLIYSCPEIVQNTNYNQKADVWSLGCILYELMSLQVPFTGNNALLLAKNIVNKQFNAPLPEKYSPKLKKFVELCLIVDQKERPVISDLLKEVVDKIMCYSDELKEKEVLLSEEIFYMNKKINSGGGLGLTQTRRFMSTFQHQNSYKEDNLLQTQLVKMDS